MASYDVEEELGRGGMGVVYRAVQKPLGRRVALKVLLPEVASNPETCTRFLREIKSLMALQHPNIVRVLDCGQFQQGGPLEGQWYYAMEMVEGRSLEDLCVREGGLGVQRSLLLIRQAAEALACCHGAGLIHRDVKPPNMMVREKDHLLLMDFGLARKEAGTLLTEAGKVMGTPRYIPPEVIEGQPPTPAADVYALGISLYRLLSPEVAFGELELEHLLRAILRGHLRPLRSIDPAIPVAVDGLVALMTHRLPGKRPPSDKIAGLIDRAIVRGSQPLQSPGRRTSEDRTVRLDGVDASGSGSPGSSVASRGAGTPAPWPPWAKGVLAALVSCCGILVAMTLRTGPGSPKDRPPFLPSGAGGGGVGASVVPVPAGGPRGTGAGVAPASALPSRIATAQVEAMAGELHTIVVRVASRRDAISNLVKETMVGFAPDYQEAIAGTRRVEAAEEGDLALLDGLTRRLESAYDAAASMPTPELGMLVRMYAYGTTRWCRIAEVRHMASVFQDAQKSGRDGLMDVPAVGRRLTEPFAVGSDGLPRFEKFFRGVADLFSRAAIDPACAGEWLADTLSDVRTVALNSTNVGWTAGARAELARRLDHFKGALRTLPGPAGAPLGSTALVLWDLGSMDLAQKMLLEPEFRQVQRGLGDLEGQMPGARKSLAALDRQLDMDINGSIAQSGSR